jgi:heme-degrading monooxygenase HmoA
MIAQIVRFKSRLSDEEVLRMSQIRAPRYRALEGLRQKYYLRFTETEEYGAVYLWESEADMMAFRDSELGRTIATAYEVQGVSSFQTAEVVMTLRPDS